MKYLQVLFTTFLAITFLGCASAPATRIQVERAPEIIVPGAKTIKINRFGMSSNSYPSSLNEIHKANLQSAFFDNKTFKVISSGPADITLTGTLNFVKRDDAHEVTVVKKNEPDTYYYESSRDGVLKVHMIVTDSTGEMVGSSRFSIHESSTATGSHRKEALRNLGPSYDMIERALNKSIVKIMRRITPYTEMVKRSFAEAENEQIEAANDAAEDGKWEQALSGWKSAESSDIDARAASYYNQSIYFERKGDLAKARQLVQKAIDIKPEKSFISRQAELSKLIKERQSLQQYFSSNI